MRARLALYSSGITVELREIVLRDKPAHMLEISPKGTVPVLLLPNGNVIDESLDIMTWALTQNDPQQLLSTDMTQALSLIARNDTTFKDALDRYKYPDRARNGDSEKAFEDARPILEDLNTRIKANQGALLDQQDTLADLAIFPFIRQFAHVDQDRFSTLPLEALQNWLKRHKNSAAFTAIMPKFKPWQDGDQTQYFGKHITHLK